MFFEGSLVMVRLFRIPTHFAGGLACALFGGHLVLLGVFNVTSSRSHCGSSCYANLMQMRGAKENWLLENKDRKDLSSGPSEEEIFGPENYIARKPACPGGGTYRIGKINEPPSCTAHPLRIEGGAVFYPDQEILSFDFGYWRLDLPIQKWRPFH